MDDVVPWGISRERGFRRNRRIHRTNVRFDRGQLGILRISGKGDEAYRRQDGKDGYDDDEFAESESGDGLSASLRRFVQEDARGFCHAGGGERIGWRISYPASPESQDMRYGTYSPNFLNSNRKTFFWKSAISFDSMRIDVSVLKSTYETLSP